MNNAKLYSSKNSLQQNDSIYVTKNFLKCIKWRSSRNTILDIGSGDGHTLCEILLPKISEKTEKIIGIDVSSDMVNFSRKKYGSENITFEEMDIAAVDIPVEFFEKFDHIFSFFCLHWVLKQSLAFKNIYEMLKPNGYILLTHLAKNPIYEIYEQMAKMDKWRPYMKDYRKYLSPYQASPDPEQELRNLMEKIGFHVEICRVEERSFSFPNMDKVYESVKAVNPFLSKIPETKHVDYFEDYTTVMRKLTTVKIERTNNNDEETIVCYYHLFIVIASKMDYVK